ncbi:karyopherin beta [Quaeritorhiza haematococci]|nr:karyopherin beta [Quaeritorhiza haematococci]
MSIAEYLANALSPDHHTREEATSKLEQFEKENFTSYLVLLCQELANEHNSPSVRGLAGIGLKNAFTAKEQGRRDEQLGRWIQMDPNTRAQVRQCAVSILGAQDKSVGMSAAQAVAAIAAIDLPRNEWPDLITGLLSHVTNTDNTNLKMCTLQAIGYICEAIDPEVLASQANHILTAVAQGARKEEPSSEVRLAAMQALYNSLEFIKDNFEKEGERNYIMMIVCEATQSTDSYVQVAAYQCLVKIMSLYYDKMALYMQKALYGLTLLGMKHEDEKVALQAIEFWSTVCEEETELNYEAQEAFENGEPMDRVNHNFARSAVAELVPVLLWLLTKKEEDDDEDTWNVAMGAGTCLGLLANCVDDAIIPIVLPFVQTHIRSNDWRYREAAVMAFGSILEGPNGKVLVPIVQQALPVLIEMMKDPVIHVKDTTAWTLGRVCEVLPDAIKDQDLSGFIAALLFGLQDTPRVASNCSFAFINLSEQLGSESDDSETYALSQYFESIVTTLLHAVEKPSDSNFKATSYEAISSMVYHCSKDCFPTVQKLATEVLGRLESTLAMQNQLVGPDDKIAHLEMQANLCSVMTSIIRRLSSQIAPLADRIMQTLLMIMNSASKSSTVMEDAFLTVSAITQAVEADFARYMDSFTPFLFQALSNVEEHSMCSIAVGLVGDISRALNDQVLVYCDNFMNYLMNALQSPVLHRNVKPVIVSCFGDIALAIGGQFEKYLKVVMLVLQQAANTRVQLNDYAMIDYQSQLRESIVEAYVGIVQGLKTGDQINMFAEHLPSVFGFLQVVHADVDRTETTTRAMLGLLGDVGEAFPPGHLKMFYQQDWIDKLVKEVRTDKHASPATKDVARWAREKIKAQVTGSS